MSTVKIGAMNLTTAKMTFSPHSLASVGVGEWSGIITRDVHNSAFK